MKTYHVLKHHTI